MSKKRTTANLRVKLNRLRQLEESNQYQYRTLNEYANYLNQVINDLNLHTVNQIQQLGPGQTAAMGTQPSNSEREKLNEIINKYSEALTEINPNHGQSIINEFKETTNKFKLIVLGINIALLISCGRLFYTIGLKDGNNQKDALNQQLIEKQEEIKILQQKVDSLDEAHQGKKNKTNIHESEISTSQDSTKNELNK